MLLKMKKILFINYIAYIGILKKNLFIELFLLLRKCFIVVENIYTEKVNVT